MSEATSSKMTSYRGGPAPPRGGPAPPLFDRDENNSFFTLWEKPDFQKKLQKQEKLIDDQFQNAGKVGSSVVIGKLSPTLRARINEDVTKVNEYMKRIYSDKWNGIKLRNEGYWHITVYGTFNPYDTDSSSIEQNVKKAGLIKESVKENMMFPEFDITYDGLGMMGFGLISGRVHDSPTVVLMRDTLGRTCKDCSKQMQYYNPTNGDFPSFVVNKIVLGTIQEMTGDGDVHVDMLNDLRYILQETRKEPLTERVQVNGTHNKVQLVHYSNEMLSAKWPDMEESIDVLEPFAYSQLSENITSYASELQRMSAWIPELMKGDISLEYSKSITEKSYDMYKLALKLQSSTVWNEAQQQVRLVGGERWRKISQITKVLRELLKDLPVIPPEPLASTERL